MAEVFSGTPENGYCAGDTGACLVFYLDCDGQPWPLPRTVDATTTPGHLVIAGHLANPAPRLRLAGRQTFVCLGVLAVAGPVVLVADSGGPALDGLAPLELPEEVANASDLRWSEDGVLLLGVDDHGVYSWRVGADHAELFVTLAGSPLSAMGRNQNYSRLGGFSAGALAVSSFADGVLRHEEGEFSYSKAVSLVGDVDRRHGRTAIVGVNRGEDGDWEDRLAWLIRDDGTVRGLLPRRTESSHWSLAKYLGVVRVLSEERVLVIPGLEPGVFLYDGSGRLRDTLGTEAFFAESPWRITPEQDRLLIEKAWRAAWLSQHRVVDEAVADDRGNIFFFVRHAPKGLPYPEDISLDSRGEVSGSVAAQHRDLLERIEKEGLEAAEPTGEGGPRTFKITDPELVDAFLRIKEPQRAEQLAKVCWDLVHAHVDELRAATKTDCVVETEFADRRLRADADGARVAILLQGNTYRPGGPVRPAEVFEARLVPPGP